MWAASAAADGRTAAWVQRPLRYPVVERILQRALALVAYVRNSKHRGQSVALHQGWNGSCVILERLLAAEREIAGQRHDERLRASCWSHLRGDLHHRVAGHDSPNYRGVADSEVKFPAQGITVIEGSA